MAHDVHRARNLVNSGRLKTCPKFFNRLLLNALRNDAPRDLFAGAERDDDIVADERTVQGEFVSMICLTLRGRP